MDHWNGQQGQQYELLALRGKWIQGILEHNFKWKSMNVITLMSLP